MSSYSEPSDLPKLVRVRQRLESGVLKDIPGTVRSELDSLGLGEKLRGGNIAITAGSRGIANIPQIIRGIVNYVRAQGGKPFLVPSMGSHGGATAEGQRMVLQQYGIDETTMGCPVKSSMETVFLGSAANGAPVYFDKNAFESDGIIVCNRVKPHTDFSADNESGIVKMVAIGLGKEKGCSAMHACGLAESIPLSCRVSLEKAPILCGLAILENSRDETYELRGVPRDRFLEMDAELLKRSKSLVPHLPADRLDLLVVKEIGKIYSGTGMDTKVIGRIRVPGVPEPRRPDIRTVVALRMNEHSYGNALGIGLADITTKALVDGIDRASMYSNLIATTYLERGKIPIYFDTEREAVETGFRVCGAPPSGRVAVIENTLHLENLLVSEPVLADNPDLEVVEREVPFTFDEAGRLRV